jgi:hypothetical protein
VAQKVKAALTRTQSKTVWVCRYEIDEKRWFMKSIAFIVVGEWQR